MCTKERLLNVVDGGDEYGSWRRGILECAYAFFVPVGSFGLRRAQTGGHASSTAILAMA